MAKIECEGYTVEYKDDEATKQAVFDLVLRFYKNHKCFSGESVMQCDGPQTDAPDVMAHIADEILCFKTTYEND